MVKALGLDSSLDALHVEAIGISNALISVPRFMTSPCRLPFSVHLTPHLIHAVHKLSLSFWLLHSSYPTYLWVIHIISIQGSSLLIRFEHSHLCVFVSLAYPSPCVQCLLYIDCLAQWTCSFHSLPTFPTVSQSFFRVTFISWEFAMSSLISINGGLIWVLQVHLLELLVILFSKHV